MKKLKEKLSAKLSKNGGFTLIEMLIVVAIIAILIAVSIPLVGSALESAREATDAANERAFKAALVSNYLLTEAKMDGGTDVKAGHLYSYDAVNGKVITTGTKPDTGYGKSENGGSSPADCKGKVLYGTINTDGDVFMKWDEKGKTVGTTTDALDKSGDLVSADLMTETTT